MEPDTVVSETLERRRVSFPVTWGYDEMAERTAKVLREGTVQGQNVHTPGW